MTYRAIETTFSLSLLAVALALPACGDDGGANAGDGDSVKGDGDGDGDAGIGDGDGDLTGTGGQEAIVQNWECLSEEGAEPDSLVQLGCQRDFEVLSAEPTDSSLPGAMSTKLVIDREEGNAIHFQNSTKYQVHYEFASENLSGVRGLPIVNDPSAFNDNYYSAQRRFYLGAVTYYDGPAKWVFELSPYDTASAEMVTEAYETIVAATFFGGELFYHPSGENAERVIPDLPESVQVITTDELYQGIDYQPLTLGKSCGKLIFYTAKELEEEYVSFQDIVVLDSVPNDISVAQGIITAEFQTPLSHVNVLSQNRNTPNMGLRGAFENAELRALEGKWVTFEVGANSYSIFESNPDDSADCLVQPVAIEINDMNLSVTELTDIETIYNPDLDIPMKEQISTAISAFGGKASHYSALSYVEEANAPKAFVIPVYFYNQFMTENKFNERIDEMLADDGFNTDAATRDLSLATLRDDMLAAPINQEFMDTLLAKLEADYPGVRMRFRSSTNAEDLGDFTGAGLYTSKSGQPGSATEPVAEALKTVWASIWFFRAFEERAYRGIDHKKVGMAILSHRSFPEEEANGVAATANPYDTTGTEGGFYVNVQYGDASVVQPAPDTTTDQFLYYFDQQGQPVVFLGHSNLVAEGENVLTRVQTHDLGVALKAIHQFFYVAYGSDNPSGWYAMDVEFKFDGERGEEPVLFVKQARPYPGR